MNPLWTQIIIQTTPRHKKNKSGDKDRYSDYQLAKSYLEFLITTKRHIKDFFLITLGIFCNLPENLDSLKVAFYTFKLQKDEKIKVY